MRRWCVLFFVAATFSKAHAQSLFHKPGVAAQVFYGSFLTRLPKAWYLRDSYSSFAEISLVQQTDGRQAWQVANGLPQVGLALFSGNTGSRKYMGRMAGAFPFVNWALYSTSRFRSGFRAGAGLGWIQKPYDKITNHKAVLIGTHLNAYLNFSGQVDYQIFSNIHITAGLSFSHFSNGSSTLPNLGLNIPAVSLGLQYGVLKKWPAVKTKPVSTHNKKNSVTMFTSLGIKQAPWVAGRRYLINTAQLEWSRAVWASGRYSGGLAFFYDRALEINPLGILDQKANGSKLQAGVYAGYEHFLGRLSVPVQLGLYVYNRGLNSTVFQQLGFRYRFASCWSLQLAMKTHSGKADFLHLGVGYRIR